MAYKNNTLMTGLFLSTILAGAHNAHAADIIYFANGDSLSGTITNQTDQMVMIDTDYGALTIPQSKIFRTTTTEAEAKVIVNIPETAMTNETPTPSLPTTDIVAIEPAAGITDKTKDIGLWGAQWSGDINAGAEMDTGNSDSSSFLIDGKTTANWDDIHRMTIAADYEYEEENDETTTDERTLSGTYDYFFADKWFWNNTAKFEQDDVDALDLRTTMTSGLGYQIYDTDDLNLEITFGPGYEREEYENQDAEDDMTANWSLGYEQKFYDDLFRVFHNHTITTPADDVSAYLFESDSGIKMPIRSGIIATGEVEFDWNNAPADGNVEDDTTYRLKIGYEW